MATLHFRRSAQKGSARWLGFALFGLLVATVLVFGDVRTPPMMDVRYANCDAARAHGAAPIYIGQPGYEPRLDADHDGIACEPWVGTD